MLNKQKFISEFLSAIGIITPQQLEQVKLIQQRTQESIIDIFKKLGIIEDDNLSELIVEQLGLAYVKLGHYNPEPKLLKIIEPFYAHHFRILPLRLEKESLTIAVDNPLNFLSLEYFSSIFGYNLDGELIARGKMDELLEKYYLQDKEVISYSEKDAQKEAASLMKTDAPVIRLVNMLIGDAYRKRASDIHVEPMSDKLRLRYRIDGFLQEIPSPAKNLQASIISRIKLMAGMNIAEKRLPQDGRIRTMVDNKEFDLRVSSLPAQYGESVVLRILDRRLLGFEELGFSDIQLNQFRNLINFPNGIILVTGPTGSGKSTTLYAALSSLDRKAKKILTVEDPVEYQINGINQIQVKPNIGLSFARVLRSMLRQAPDIIMVGEIRDLETASISVQAALTGHLIFSTLHTNDAPSAITRLVDMGVKPYLIAATLQAVLAQRLIRLLCTQCKEPYKPPKDEMKILELNQKDTGFILYRAKGCSRCSHTGYFGRTGIFELLVVNDEIRQLSYENMPSSRIREKARALGMMTLKEHVTQKVLSGLTTVQELVRVTQSDVD